MNTSIEDYIKALGQPQTSKNMLKILSAMRKEADWPKNRSNINKIREKGSLKHLIYTLQSSHKHIVDVSLSILGNCAMDKNSARESVGTYNILSALNQVLKRFPKEDSINGRVFRILGNLCHHKQDWSNLIIDRKPQIVTHLIDLLRNNANEEITDSTRNSEATVLMALRHLKYLINQYTIKHLLKTFPVLNVIGSLFIKCTQEWQRNHSNENVLNSIISLLHNCSRYRDYSMILELKSTAKGNALEQLTNVLLLSPKKVIKIIMNLIRISQLKSDLPVPEIYNKFIDEVLKKNVDSQGFRAECFDYIKCLCQLLDHPANRNNQCAKTIPLLIEFLKKLDSPVYTELQCCLLLVYTLNKCQYEESLTHEQLKCNILDVLVKKLEWVVQDSDILNTKHRFKKGQKRKSSALMRRLEFGEDHNGYGKRKMCSCADCLEMNSINPDCPFVSSFIITSSPLSTSISEESYNHRQLSPLSSDDELGYSFNSKYDRTPSPCSSSSSDYAGLSWGSPCSSPRSMTNEASYSDSDDYSPVCSEADSTEFPLVVNTENEVASIDGDRYSEGTENDDKFPFEVPLEENSVDKLKLRLVSEIAKLIRSYIRIKPPILQLGSENLLLALLNCSELYTTKHVTYISTLNVLCDILHSSVYLIPLMKTHFVEKIYGLTEFVHTSHCVICVDHSCIGKMVLKKFTNLAECAAGKGDIAHELLRGSNDVKKQLVLVIPYIVEDRTILSKLMLNCGGLNILLELLKEDSTFKNRSIKVLCALASKKLKIANPKKMAMDIDDDKFTVINHRSNDSVNLVTFKLDDGTFIKADRDFLMEKSDYFNSLLNGYFKERVEDEISLHNVEFNTLNCLLRLVECTSVLEKVDTDTLLDVISLSDRYLMSDICCYVTNYVEKYKISSKTVPVIYRWSLESGLNLLRVESIAFALVGNIVDRMRYTMFNELFDLGYSEELVNDIKKLLERYLSSFSK